MHRFQIKHRLRRLLPRLRNIRRGGQAVFETRFRRLQNLVGRIQRRLRDVNAAARLGQFVKRALHFEDDFLVMRVEAEVGGEQLVFRAGHIRRAASKIQQHPLQLDDRRHLLALDVYEVGFIERQRNRLRLAPVVRRSLQREHGIILALGQTDRRGCRLGVFPRDFGFGMNALGQVNQLGKFIIFLRVGFRLGLDLEHAGKPRHVRRLPRAFRRGWSFEVAENVG